MQARKVVYLDPATCGHLDGNSCTNNLVCGYQKRHMQPNPVGINFPKPWVTNCIHPQAEKILKV